MEDVCVEVRFGELRRRQVVDGLILDVDRRPVSFVCPGQEDIDFVFILVIGDAEIAELLPAGQGEDFQDPEMFSVLVPFLSRAKVWDERTRTALESGYLPLDGALLTISSIVSCPNPALRCRRAEPKSIRPAFSSDTSRRLASPFQE